MRVGAPIFIYFAGRCLVLLVTSRTLHVTRKFNTWFQGLQPYDISIDCASVKHFDAII